MPFPKPIPTPKLKEQIARSALTAYDALCTRLLPAPAPAASARTVSLCTIWFASPNLLDNRPRSARVKRYPEEENRARMSIHLINPSDNAFGTAVITPRWLFVLAAATPRSMGDPILTDECLEQLDPNLIRAGDIVGISVHTGNALRGYHVGKLAHERGATVVYGGIHATLFPEEPFERGAADVVVKGDGDLVWSHVLRDLEAGHAERVYEGGKIGGEEFLPARWDLMQADKYMWASVQTIRGCPKHCSFCSVWRTDGQKPRQRAFRAGGGRNYRFAPAGLSLYRSRRRQFLSGHADRSAPGAGAEQPRKLESLTQVRNERFLLMAELAKLPKDMVFFTQITMESAEDPEYLDAMRQANIKGALVGVEAVTPEGLKSVYKDFNYTGDRLIEQLKTFREHGVHVLGSSSLASPAISPPPLGPPWSWR